MKNKWLNILLCGILVLGFTGCGKENNNTSTDTKDKTSTTDTKDEVTYSKCAKEGNKCSEQDILDGQLVKVKLNNSKSGYFYVIGDDGDTLTLIMNGYIETPWVSSEDIKGVCNSEKDGKSCGPYTAIKNLNEATKDWTNIKNINSYSYDVEVSNVEDHYKSLKINNGVTTLTGNSNKEYTISGDTKARLMTLDEIEPYKATDWLRNKVAEDYDAKKIKHIYVLTATPSYGGYDGTVSTISCKYNTNITKINVDNELILMPVISVSKKDIK